jgi:hypothetical protein
MIFIEVRINIMKKSNDLKVFIATRESSCEECKEVLGHKAWITLRKNKGALCLACADMDHLVFLPSGNATLTRRARKYSVLSAVVLKWSRARKRYERQGILVEAEALEQAEKDCLEDSEARARRRERDAERRAVLDVQYIENFAKRIRDLFPRCPPGRDVIIAEHACLKYSGRIGRSAEAKSFDEETIRLAVIAHIRHSETQYDKLMVKGFVRREARKQVQNRVNEVLRKWEG